MKEQLKKLVAFVTSALMALALVPGIALAANDGSITIDNSKTGSTYTVYKVFDATYSGENVAYTYDGSNQAFLAALQGNNSPFTVTKNSTNTYNVAAKTGATGESIATFLKGQENNLGTAVKTATGNGQAVKVEGLAYGYYYVTTTTGSAVTIDSAVKDVTVIDKNTNTPGQPDKQSSTDGTTFDNSEKTASIGDKVDYKITGTVKRYGNSSPNADAVAVTKLTYTDTMTKGLTRGSDLVVKIGTTTLTKVDNATATGTYSVTDTTNANGASVQTITIPMASTDADGNVTFFYNEGAAIEITYSGTVNESAVAGTADTNTVDLTWNDSNESGSDTTKVTTYSFGLFKDKSDKTQLDGAEFTLTKDGNTIHFKKSGDTYTVTSTAPAEDNGVTDTITAGNVTISGLGNGTYTLTETKAPDGYNQLTEAKTVTVNGANNPVVLQDGKYSSGGVEVTNLTGTELPKTGGMGTTLFTVVGAALVVAAGVLLVTRRRMQQ